MDHIFGLDEIRRYNWIQNETIPIYGKKETLEDIKRIFSYAFKGYNFPGGIPKLEVNVVEEKFMVRGIPVEPIPIQHGNWIIFGFRIGDFAYLTDCNGIPGTSMDKLRNLKILVLDALRIRKHPTHFHLEEAIANARRIHANHTYFTHLSHDIEHSAVDRTLPDGINLGYDGLNFEI
jgi:phosphoribosyl 1,2-cyclic phosphate phosphodiesterase